LRNVSFEKALPRKQNKAAVVMNAGMLAKLAEEEAKKEADEILRPKVNMEKSFAA
jgi:hypothetical protein